MKINVSASGAVILGDVVSCDGFFVDYPIRVQTHVHKDHMYGFIRSKGRQDIFMSQPTHELLIAEYNADLDIRFKPQAYSIKSDSFSW